MPAKTTLKALMEKECVIMPCVYDCASARVLELTGYKAMMFSSGELSEAVNGLPDMGLVSADETEWAVSRICRVNSLPLAVDIEDGFGGPIQTYRTVKRMVNAGAMAVQLEDESQNRDGLLLPRDDYYAKVKAALKATEGSDCLVIARTNADPKTELDEGCRRMKDAHELGAHITTVVRLDNFRDAAYVAQRVPGWKMYPDNNSISGVAEVTAEQVYPLGFNLITMHFLLKTAMDGMITAARHNIRTGDNDWSNDNMRALGVCGASAMPYFDIQGLMEFESQFTGVVRKFRHPALEQNDD